MKRRGFLKSAAATVAAAASGPLLGQGGQRILILGGTAFLGPQIVRFALARGHEVTLFNRGRTNPDLFPELERLRGDRDGDLAALRGRQWDAVVDTSGYLPRVVAQSVDLLADSVERYLFVSTISVYASLAEAGIDESAPVGQLPDPTVETIDGETYGPLKALCEEVVRERFGERATILRPGLIVGPGDRTDRFTYWPVRVARGGDVLAPGDGTDPVQVIDVRDLGEWTVHCLEAGVAGTYNADGPPGELDMRSVLAQCLRAADGDARLRWAPTAFLESQGVEPWSDLPLWVPAGSEFAGAAEVNVDRALAAGLRSRPLADTVEATLAWFIAERGLQDPLRAGMSAERERELLELLAQSRPADDA
jgi:2'-hydroxyisoflavone reductase